MTLDSYKNFVAIVESGSILSAANKLLIAQPSLSNQLKNIETQLSEQRRYYNAVIKKFNTERELFPKSIIAGMMHLEKAPYFELDSDEERKNVQVKF